MDQSANLSMLQVNLSFVPDGIERELYFSILRLLLNVAATSAGQLRLDVFGVRADFAIR